MAGIKNSRINIPGLAKKIKQKFNPKQVILFGSYARGNAKEESDIDLLVVMNTPLKPYQQAARIRIALDEAFGVTSPIDILVRTPLEIEKRVKAGDFFLKTVMEQGISL